MKLNLWLTLFGISVVSTALDADQIHRETATIEIIEVPVYVTRDGAPLSNLTRAQFALFVNGKPQAVHYFDAVDFAGSKGDETHRELRHRRLYLLLFDLSYSSGHTVARAQKAAEDLVAKSKPGSDLFAVATYSHRHGIRFLIPFSVDRVAIARAIRSLQPSRAGDPLGLAISSVERAAWITGTLPSGSVAELGADAGTLAGELAIEPERRRIEDQIEHLTRLVDQMRKLDGQKHVILFSDGFDTRVVHGVGRTAQSASADPRLIGAVDRMSRQYRAGGVFLHALDIRGLRHTWNSLENEALFLLTNGTGGEVVRNHNDLSEGLLQLSWRHERLYLLGFRAPEQERNENRIEVRLRGVKGGATVVHRRGYSRSRSRSEPVTESLYTADIILNDTPRDDLSLRARVSSGTSSATVTLEVPGPEILSLISGQNSAMEVLLYVFDEQNAVVAHRHKRITIDVARAARQLEKSGLRLRETFELQSGVYAGKVLIRLGGDLMSFARVDFTVPGSKTSEEEALSLPQ